MFICGGHSIRVYVSTAWDLTAALRELAAQLAIIERDMNITMPETSAFTVEHSWI